MSESKELVLVTLPAAADLEEAFISDEYIDRLITDIRQKATSVVGDVNTVKGRGVYISMASTVRRTKTVIDDAGKALVAEMKKRPALVDASRKKVRDALDELAVDIRRPATEWEEAKARVEAEELAKKEAEALAARLDVDHEMALLMNDAFDREQAEKKAEAERQRIAHEEEIKRQAEEKAKREAAEQAQREIDAAASREREALLAKERAEREKKEAAEKAERDRIAAEQKAEADKQAAIDAERRKAQEEADRIRRETEAKEAALLAEQKRIAEEEARRAADVEHRRSINATAVQALIDQGIPEDWAKSCVVAIARGKVPATTIKY
ncbi:TPA: hypothetical protein SHS77_004273 [Raoultella planticola]|uniref:hypothetical protein n=1 Tax=Raoultella ornithinolytica TaxID=54291 RepID=UPI00292BF7DB|nr:hypothetical protein [Raoultella ornithinolytica]MDV1093922.1 hypothetical protein [Raoultella ornithinolytica]MDV1120784.1 hypothetical protein [Raoultella ornithinolytica]MDV1891145.1 hypothetical protein [Raoultella ornithinolytica]HEH6362484.1 hypothetical protein [Raoultella planticola]